MKRLRFPRWRGPSVAAEWCYEDCAASLADCEDIDRLGTKLAEWYQANLGVTSVPDNYDALPWRTSAATTVFAPFKEDTSYFGDRRFQWMINFRVRDLDKMVAQLR